MEKPDNQMFCRECGAVIAKNAEICPQCGVRQMDGPKPKSTGSKVLIGCLIAAGVVLFAIPVIGIVAAIAIPKFANTREKAYVASMKSDLRKLVVAEEGYFEKSQRYTSDFSKLDFEPSIGVSTPALTVGKGYWSATVTHGQLARKVCGIAVNTSNTVDPLARDGEPACR